MTATLISADHLLTGFAPSGRAEITENGALLVEGSRILDLGPAEHLRRKYSEAVAVGGRKRLVMPGLINAHHHVGLTPFQLGARDQPLELWFPERLCMRDVDSRLDTLYAAFEMIGSGVTTVQHLHSRAPGDPAAVVARAESILRAYDEIGMRVSYSFAMRDQNRMIYAADEEFLALLPPHLRRAAADYLASFQLPLAEQIAVFRSLRDRWADHPLTAIQIAPSNLHWLSDAALESAARLSDETGAPMHMHLLETPYQYEYARRRTGGSAVAFLDRLGLLSPRLTIGHGVWMTPEDMACLAERGTCLCHNCSSNLRLKSGTLDLNAVLAANIPTGLGMDEAGINDDRDMLQEMRLALTLHRPAGHDAPAPTAEEILRMATEYGAATTPFAGRIGRLAPGMLADLVVMDWAAVTAPWQDPAMPVIDTLVRRAKAGAVETVMIGGQVVYHEGRFAKVSREEVHAEITRAMTRPDTEAEVARRRLATDLIGPVRNFYQDWHLP